MRLRVASLSDERHTFYWATDSSIRKFSFQTKKIDPEEHRQWFEKKINDSQCAYYILEDGDKILGSIRFDIEKGGIAMISYLIDSNYHGCGYGRKIVEMGIFQIKKEREDVQMVYGFVMVENVPSGKIFMNLGFDKVSTVNGHFKYVKQI